MVNPIKHLKHLWKDPINTIDEANARKKEIMPWLYGSIGVAVGFCGLDGILGTGILMIFGMIGIFGVMAFGFMLFVIGKAKDKFESLTCNKCHTMAEIKTREDFEKYVNYSIGEYRAEYHGINHPSSQDGVVSKIEAKASATIRIPITLTCPNCGETKELRYTITPFKCSASQSKVPVRDVELVKMRLENEVKEVVEDYNDIDKRNHIPYSIHSKKNPNYADRSKPQINASKAHPNYKGVQINYRKDPEEMVEAFFLENQIDGNLTDLSKSNK